MTYLSEVFEGAAPAFFPHPDPAHQVRFIEVTPDLPDALVSQLVGQDAVHDIGSQTLEDLRHFRIGGPGTNKRCFAMMDPGGKLQSAIYVHLGDTKIESYSDLAGDVMPILEDEPTCFTIAPQSFHCYSISGQLAGAKGMGPVLVRNLHHFLTTNYPGAVISTLSPMRDFDRLLGQGASRETWAGEHDVSRYHSILSYLAARGDGVQKFHMGNGAIIGAIRLSHPNGVGDSKGINGCMVNYIYDADATRLEANARLFKSGASLIQSGLVDRSLVSLTWGMTEKYQAGVFDAAPALNP